MNRRLSASLLFLAMASPALACLWDYDTLQMEQQRFPEALDLITGRFLRHSPEFYRWRVQDRERRLEQKPDDPALPDWYDDLAVAHSKLGNHQRGIELMLKKEQLFPGRYKTRANLGTFYIFEGRLEEAAEQIELALKIDPDAHFGREVYQLHLVRYLLSQRQDDGEIRFPLAADKSNFAAYLRSVTPEDQRALEITKATKGVLGMMHFANFESPLLLEALGDLLLDRPEDAKQLAARAYLKASYSVQDESARKAYRELAAYVLRMQLAHGKQLGKYEELTLEALEAQFAQEIAAGKQHYEKIRTDELAWIKAGDPEEAFAEKYYTEPESLGASASGLPLWMFGGLGFLVFAAIFGGWRWSRAAAVRAA